MLSPSTTPLLRDLLALLLYLTSMLNIIINYYYDY